MSIASFNWPASLPVASQEFTAAPNFGHVSTTMDSGRLRRVNKESAAVWRFNVKFKFDRGQLYTFKRFFADDLNHGTYWFNIQTLNANGEDDTVNTAARFIGGYNETTRHATQWEVTATLEYLFFHYLTFAEASIFNASITLDANGTLIWPDSISGPSAFSVIHNPSVAISTIGSYARTTARHTTRTEQAKVQFQFKKYEFETFVYMFRARLNSGVKWFLIYLPVGDDLDNMVEVATRFISGYTIDYVGGLNNMNVTATIEYQLPTDLISLADRAKDDGTI